MSIHYLINGTTVPKMKRYSRLLSHTKFLAQGVHRIVSDIDLDVGDAHLGASADETPCKREPDALGTPRNDGPLAANRKWHLDGSSPLFLLSEEQLVRCHLILRNKQEL